MFSVIHRAHRITIDFIPTRDGATREAAVLIRKFNSSKLVSVEEGRRIYRAYLKHGYVPV